jgi:pimeloyl-ACP methyl ester carboxylesterase
MQQTIVLEDGRQMGYAHFGDPAGRPCLLVPGFSSSRWAAGWVFAAADLHRHGMRLIGVDRPGYGLSTPHTGFTAWGRDASKLLDHLGVDRVAVMGLSMGAGPALALAAARPDLVTSTTILGGMGPVGVRERWSPASRGDAVYWRLARRAPWLLRRLCSISATMMAKAWQGDMETFISRAERGLPEADLRALREALDSSDARAAFVADVQESCRQGGAAMAEDLLQYLRPWGFDLADVRGPVYLWHGLEDPKVPVMLGRRLADRLPHATAEYVPGGHFAALAHREKILSQIVG